MNSKQIDAEQLSKYALVAQFIDEIDKLSEFTARSPSLGYPQYDPINYHILNKPIHLRPIISDEIENMENITENNDTNNYLISKSQPLTNFPDKSLASPLITTVDPPITPPLTTTSHQRNMEKQSLTSPSTNTFNLSIPPSLTTTINLPLTSPLTSASDNYSNTQFPLLPQPFDNIHVNNNNDNNNNEEDNELNYQSPPKKKRKISAKEKKEIVEVEENNDINDPAIQKKTKQNKYRPNTNWTKHKWPIVNTYTSKQITKKGVEYDRTIYVLKCTLKNQKKNDELCNKEIKSIDIKSHCKSCHHYIFIPKIREKLEWYSCTFSTDCNWGSNVLTDYQSHMNSHYSDKKDYPFPFECTGCGEIFRNKTNIWKHWIKNKQCKPDGIKERKTKKKKTKKCKLKKNMKNIN